MQSLSAYIFNNEGMILQKHLILFYNFVHYFVTLNVKLIILIKGNYMKQIAF